VPDSSGGMSTVVYVIAGQHCECGVLCPLPALSGLRPSLVVLHMLMELLSLRPTQFLPPELDGLSARGLSDREAAVGVEVDVIRGRGSLEASARVSGPSPLLVAGVNCDLDEDTEATPLPPPVKASCTAGSTW